jgi:maltose alpha-D-glucosyltransferase/alpha-amylase
MVTVHPQVVSPSGSWIESGLRNRPIPHGENRPSIGFLPLPVRSSTYRQADAEPATLAMLQGLVANEGDGWKWTVEELDRYYEACAALTFPENARAELGDPLDLSEKPTSQLARDHVGIYLDSAAVLGRRTAELHLALASPTNNLAFAPEPMTPDDLLAQVSDTRAKPRLSSMS